MSLNRLFLSNLLLLHLRSDISFLCEATTSALAVPPAKPVITQKTTDKSAIRAVPSELKSEPVSLDEFFSHRRSTFPVQAVVLPESIIPDEFRIVKNVGVTPIEVFDE